MSNRCCINRIKVDEEPSTLSNCHRDFSPDDQFLRPARCTMCFIVDLLARSTTDCPCSAQELWCERFVSRSAPRRVARAVGTTVTRSIYDTAKGRTACREAAHEGLDEW
jgi:hypothetical protein